MQIWDISLGGRIVVFDFAHLVDRSHGWHHTAMVRTVFCLRQYIDFVFASACEEAC
jgi:hypothetical protein